jgi:hypothetical protein
MTNGLNDRIGVLLKAIANGIAVAARGFGLELRLLPGVASRPACERHCRKACVFCICERPKRT